jgi:hypothetical protein
MRELSSMSSAIRTNFTIGTAKDCNDYRAKTSLGLDAFPSSHGYCAIEAKPDPKSASGVERNIATSGRSSAARLSYR